MGTNRRTRDELLDAIEEATKGDDGPAMRAALDRLLDEDMVLGGKRCTRRQRQPSKDRLWGLVPISVLCLLIKPVPWRPPPAGGGGNGSAEALAWW